MSKHFEASGILIIKWIKAQKLYKYSIHIAVLREKKSHFKNKGDIFCRGRDVLVIVYMVSQQNGRRSVYFETVKIM